MDTIPNMVYVGENLKRARLAKAWTQRQLVAASGVSQRTIVDLENDRAEPHPSTIGKLARALGVEPLELVEGRQS